MAESNLVLKGLQWQASPSVFELLDTDFQPDKADLLTLPTWRGERYSRLEDLKRKWDSLVSRLKRYQKETELFTRQPVWVHLIDLYTPLQGKSSLKFEYLSNIKVAPEIKILGAGFGVSSKVSFSESIEFTAEKKNKALLIQLLASAWRYRDKATNTSLVRLDLENSPDLVAQKVLDLADIALPPDLDDSLKWRRLRQVDLAGASDVGAYTWEMQTESNATWKAGISTTLPLQAMGLDLNVTLEAENSEAFTLTYELPYGKTYEFYWQRGEKPIAPKVGVR